MIYKNLFHCDIKFINVINDVFVNIIYFYFSVAKLAKEEIAPLVRKMEKEGKIDDYVLKILFENGVSPFKSII